MQTDKRSGIQNIVTLEYNFSLVGPSVTFLTLTNRSPSILYIYLYILQLNELYFVSRHNIIKAIFGRPHSLRQALFFEAGLIC